VLMALVPAGTAGDPPDLTTIEMNGMPCGPEGTATSDDGKALNRLKDRFTIPTDDDIDPIVSVPAMLAPGQDKTRFDSKKAAPIQGYIIRVSFGGLSHGESCNCKSQK